VSRVQQDRAKGFCPQNRFRKEKQILDHHLTDSQIEELLRTNESCLHASCAQTEERGTGTQCSARLHLASCESCRRKVKALEAATERLALLKSPAPARAGVECPPQEVWFQIAAGLGSVNAESCLNHAIHCEKCGRLLAMAAADFCEELTPQEEAQIAALSSSSHDWQMRLAAKLQSGEAQSPAERAARSSRFAPAIAFFAPSRMALAAALIAAVILGVQDYRLQENLFDQSLQTSAAMRRLELDGEQQKGQIAELSQQQGTQQTGRSAAEAPSVSQTAASDRVASLTRFASLTLDTGLTRGSGQMKRLTIPAGAAFARIVLHTPKTPESMKTDGVMHEELLTVDRRKLWSQELKPSAAEGSTSTLSLLIPAYLLTPDDYVIVLSREADNGVEEVASYSFRVPR
jgi:negative regulator of sigma E activity